MANDHPTEDLVEPHPSLLPALRRSQAAGDQLDGAAADEIERLSGVLKAIEMATAPGALYASAAVHNTAYGALKGKIWPNLKEPT